MELRLVVRGARGVDARRRGGQPESLQGLAGKRRAAAGVPRGREVVKRVQAQASGLRPQGQGFIDIDHPSMQERSAHEA